MPGLVSSVPSHPAPGTPHTEPLSSLRKNIGNNVDVQVYGNFYEMTLVTKTTIFLKFRGTFNYMRTGSATMNRTRVSEPSS